MNQSRQIVSRHREVRRPDPDDGWWADVLHDPRARVPMEHYIEAGRPNARYRLDRQPSHIEIVCPCGLRRIMDRDRLIPQVGADMNILYLAREWMACKAKNKVTNHCRAYPAR